jgi:nicotinate dehydrogenase subunit B
MSAFLPRASRRTFLKRGAAVTVAFTLAPYFDSLAQGTPPALPGSLQTNRQLDAWLAINADETVTVFTGKVELGQGITTALAQIVADELGVDIARITMISGDTSRTPNEGVTSGSLSIEQGGTALRFAAAEAREILLAAAAAKIGVPASALTVTDGVITTPDGKRTSYGDVTRADLLRREASAKAKPRPAATHKVIGTSVARRDIPAKVTGGVAYVQDMRSPTCCSAASFARRPIAPGSSCSTMPRCARCPV